MLLNENVIILFISVLKMNIFQESNQLVAPGGLPTILHATNSRKIIMDQLYHLYLLVENIVSYSMHKKVKQ